MLMGEQHGRARRTPHVFIGRDVELAELWAGLEDAMAGRGRIFVIAGEPGVGKTMLVEQIAARAKERAARVLWGRCWEGGGAPAYWPWTQILRPLIEERGEGGRAGEDPDAPVLAALIPEHVEPSGRAICPGVSTQTPAARFRCFAAVAGVLREASSVQPMLLVLDDLHAADPASLLLLRFVAGDVRRAHLLVVVTHRGVEAHRRSDVTNALAELVREGPSIGLRGFDRAEVGQFIENLTDAAASEDDLSRICDATGGNPLFIREMVRLVGAPSGWREHPAIPEGVRAVIHQRLAFPDAEAIGVLSVAAVVGRDFHIPLVADVSGLDRAHVLQSLQDAERFELVDRALDSGAFRFTHGLVREVLYDDLPAAVRTELHGKVAAAIERLAGPDVASQLGQLAYHFAEVAASGQAAKAMEYARAAGDRAMVRHAYEDAALQYGRALEALRFAQPDEDLRCELLLRLGDAQGRAGNYHDAKQTFARAAEIARRLGAHEKLARAALGFGEPQVEGGQVDQQLIALLREALDGLGHDDSTLRARVLARLSLELSFAEDPTLRDALRERLSRHALEMARRLGDADTVATALRARWMARWGPDGLDERLALSNEMLSLAGKSGDLEGEAVGRARRISSSMERGDIRAADADIAAHARLASELRMPYHEWTATSLRAGRALLVGSIQIAEELTNRAASLLPGRPIAQLAHLNQITLIRWEQRRLGELRDVWQRIVDEFPQAGFGMAWLSLAEAELDRENEARISLSARVEQLADLPQGGLWPSTLAVAALAAARLDDPDAAEAIYPLLLPYPARTIIVPMPHPVTCLGSAALYLGLLAATMSRWDDAIDHLESAIRAHGRLQARPFLARTRYEYARLLVRRGRTADRARAVALTDQAEETARARGMTALSQDCAVLRELNLATVPTAQTDAVAAPDVRGTNVFHRDGDYWTITYDGSLVRLRDSKGLRHLSRLLGNPGREFHALDLAAEQNRDTSPESASGRLTGPGELTIRPDLGHAGELLDAQAKAEYKARLEALQSELDEADSYHDLARATKLREEIDFITDELARAVGLGGRDRKAAAHAERARLNVTRAIKAALDNIARYHPSLGLHLRSTIRTGRYCSYTPDHRTPPIWEP